jgi:hypothetical protein
MMYAQSQYPPEPVLFVDHPLVRTFLLSPQLTERIALVEGVVQRKIVLVPHDDVPAQSSVWISHDLSEYLFFPRHAPPSAAQRQIMRFLLRLLFNFAAVADVPLAIINQQEPPARESRDALEVLLARFSCDDTKSSSSLPDAIAPMDA